MAFKCSGVNEKWPFGRQFSVSDINEPVYVLCGQGVCWKTGCWKKGEHTAKDQP